MVGHPLAVAAISSAEAWLGCLVRLLQALSSIEYRMPPANCAYSWIVSKSANSHKSFDLSLCRLLTLTCLQRARFLIPSWPSASSVAAAPTRAQQRHQEYARAAGTDQYDWRFDCSKLGKMDISTPNPFPQRQWLFRIGHACHQPFFCFSNLRTENENT